MKELSVEQKAKAYDEAIEKVRQLCAYPTTKPFISDLQDLFPELKESEDERIRKWIRKELESKYVVDNIVNNVMADKALAWLEKQGEQKETFCDKCKKAQPSHSCQDITVLGRCAVEHEQKSADIVEPKFHEGDWVVNTVGDTNQVVKVWDDGYTLDNNVFLSNSWATEHYRLWTIQDAKDGDVLAYNDGSLTIFRYRLSGLDAGLYMSHVLLTNKIEFKQTCVINNVHPATKEQCDTLMKTMADAGYTFDFEKKELKKIEHKPAWSEEDESNRRSALMLLRYPITIWSDVNNNTRIKIIDWLKSLENKYISQQKQDWSEKDEERRKKIIHILSLDGRIKNEELSDINDWLKSLKERYTWKPSDEQMDMLKIAVSTSNSIVLDSLYNDLKKLKE